MGGDNGWGEDEGFSGTTIKDTWTNHGGDVLEGVEGGDDWGRGERWGKRQTTVLEQ